MKTESDILKLVHVETSKYGARVFRNNVGMAYAGSDVQWVGRDVIIKNARIIHFGLGEGSSDLIGFTRTGRFLAIETKTATGRVTDKQQNFINQVNAFGGVGFIARGLDDLSRFL